jgi:hypothetical protein
MAIYPNADTSHRYDGKFPGSYVAGFPVRGILHTTETKTRPSYRGGRDAPHFTIDPKTGHVWQHFDTKRPARALRHPDGTIETNNARAIQIEILAYSDAKLARRRNGLHIDRLTAEQLRPIAELVAWINQVHGLRPVSGLKFEPYPKSGQKHNGVRMSDAHWRKFSGWAGHMHVPHNTHGDPSDINISALLGLEDDVKVTKSQSDFSDPQPVGADWSQSLKTGRNAKGGGASLSVAGGPGYASGVISVHTQNIGTGQTVALRCFVVAKNAAGQWARVQNLSAIEQPGSGGAGLYQYAFAHDLGNGQRLRFEARATGTIAGAAITLVSYSSAVLS